MKKEKNRLDLYQTKIIKQILYIKQYCCKQSDLEAGKLLPQVNFSLKSYNFTIKSEVSSTQILKYYEPSISFITTEIFFTLIISHGKKNEMC